MSRPLPGQPTAIAAARARLEAAEARLRAGATTEALALFEAATVGPFAAFAWLRCGQILDAQGERAGARRALERAARLRPQDAPIRVALGNLLERTGERRRAAQQFRLAQRAAPRAAAPAANLAQLFLAAAKPDAAARICARALRRGVDHTPLAPAIGRVALERGDAATAAITLRDALAAMPARAELRVNFAEALLDLGRHDEAIAELRAALPHLAAPSQARLNLAYALFAAGDWPAAWREFESRFAPDAPRRSARRPDGFTLPRWDGERERGPVFVWSEQGLGDEILFAGLIAAAPQRGIDIVLECDPRLAPLIARGQPRLTIAPRTSPPSPPPASCRAQLAAGSFGAVTGWTPQAHAPRAYLAADPARSAALRQRLGGGARRLIGVSWTSRSRELGRTKTLPVEAIAALAAHPGVSLVDLQYGDTQAVQAELATRHGVTLARVPELDAFADIDGLAALIAACDAVVTVSNVTAHLAGALGIDTHVLVPRGRGRIWYWLDGDGASVWYPRARLYAQDHGRDWSRALAAVRAALTPPIR